MLEAVFTSGVDEITVHGLTQWDKGQQLKIALSSIPASFEVHFAFKRSETAYVVDAIASGGVAVVDIPNAILRQPVDAMAWIYLVDGDAGETVKTIHLPIQRRTKPADYVYEEAEVANFREIINQRMDEYLASGAITPGASVEQVAQINQNKVDIASNEAQIAELREFTLDRVEFSHTGNPVQFETFSGCPLDCVTHIEPVQAGSGNPSPSNIRPITVHTGAKLIQCGKNVLPAETSTHTQDGITFTQNADGSIRVSGQASATTTNIIATKAFAKNGENYILTGCPTGGGVGNTYSLRCYNAKGNGSVHDDIGNGAEFEFLNADGVYNFAILVWAGAPIDVTFYPMLRPASIVDDTYEPYQGDTFSADFGQTVYGGTLDWNTGVLTVDRVCKALTGTEAFVRYDGWPNLYAYYCDGLMNDAISIEGHDTVADIKCSHAVVNTPNDITTIPYSGAFVGQGVGRRLYVCLGEYATVDALKAYLAAQYAAGTPVQIAYKPDNPTIQLTPQEILALQGVNNIWSDAGETTVSGRKDILWLTDYLLKRVKELESAVATLETAAVNNV